MNNRYNILLDESSLSPSEDLISLSDDIITVCDFSEPEKCKKIKRVLCCNIINNGTCSYGDKCMFAHSVDEQVVDSDREEAYNVIKYDKDLSKLNLLNNSTLFNVLKKLTKTCSFCVKQKCPGGINCKNGSYSKKYIVCDNDMMYGTCDVECKKIHLTERGLIPYIEQRDKHMNRIWGETFNLPFSCNQYCSSESSDFDLDSAINYLNS